MILLEENLETEAETLLNNYLKKHPRQSQNTPPIQQYNTGDGTDDEFDQEDLADIDQDRQEDEIDNKEDLTDITQDANDDKQDSDKDDSSFLGSVGAGLTGGVVSKVGIKRFIPGITAGTSAYNAYHDIKKGDYLGAATEIASGAVSFIPWVGVPASIAIDWYKDDITSNIRSSANQLFTKLPTLPSDADKEVAVLQKQLSDLGSNIKVDGKISQDLVTALKQYNIKIENKSSINDFRSLFRTLNEIEQKNQTQESMVSDIVSHVSNSLQSGKFDKQSIANYIKQTYPSLYEKNKQNLDTLMQKIFDNMKSIMVANKNAIHKVAVWINKH